MNHTLNVELFLFNATTDYLPHYKLFTCTLDGKQSVKDLLKTIQEQETDFEYPKNKTLVHINGLLIDARLKIEEITEVFGTDIVIDPASTFRATKDLRFNDDDFMQKYALLEPYCSDEDLKYYRTLYRTYYGSETLKYNQDYFGDSFFLLAHRLLENENDHSDAILDLVTDDNNGMALYEFENNAYPSEDITPTIDALKVMLENRRFINSEQMQEVKSFVTKMKETFCPQEEEPAHCSKASLVLIKKYGLNRESVEDELEFIGSDISFETIAKDVEHSFKDFNIAFYLGADSDQSTSENAETLIASVGGNRVAFETATKACGSNIVDVAESIAYKKAGTILLDALDNSADIVVVNSKDALMMCDANIKKCEKAVGREIDLQIVTPSQLAAIATGITDKAELDLENNGSAITFI